MRSFPTPLVTGCRICICPHHYCHPLVHSIVLVWCWCVCPSVLHSPFYYLWASISSGIDPHLFWVWWLLLHGVDSNPSQSRGQFFPAMTVIFPDPVHLLSLTPSTWWLNCLISDVTGGGLSVSYTVIPFQCPRSDLGFGVQVLPFLLVTSLWSSRYNIDNIYTIWLHWHLYIEHHFMDFILNIG